MSKTADALPEPESQLPLTPAVFHILLALADGEKHGYAIMREVEETTGGQVRMGPGTLYGSIDRMIKSGYIAEAAVRAEGRYERRRYYALTGFGRRVAKAEARRLAEAVRSAQTKKLFFPA